MTRSVKTRYDIIEKLESYVLRLQVEGRKFLPSERNLCKCLISVSLALYNGSVVSLDNYEAGRQAAHLIVENGCKKPAYIGFSCVFFREREKGFLCGLKDAMIKFLIRKELLCGKDTPDYIKQLTKYCEKFGLIILNGSTHCRSHLPIVTAINHATQKVATELVKLTIRTLGSWNNIPETIIKVKSEVYYEETL
ncbi:MAG: hypothetical protein A2020_15110 [Lentisphaerae bacterium GWF2_45_14]|nr:MAG: hypothetical protein A2020_15110 [Lentisphaerae bacterium GWF2_45_14]